MIRFEWLREGRVVSVLLPHLVVTPVGKVLSRQLDLSLLFVYAP